MFLVGILGLASLIDFWVGDNQAFLFINQRLSNPLLDFVFLYIFVPLLSFLVVAPGFMLFFKRYRIIGILSFLGGGVCYLIGGLIKFSPRPSQVLSQVFLVGNWVVGENSFPSTTTMLAFGLALPVFLLTSRIGWLSLLLASLTGFFVVYSGYHFPEDAIAGAVICVIIILFLVFLLRKYIYCRTT
ncbi:phosphatase PAP2 family protein [bacterium]|nr:phosphatase PAP2 family protein [bacterium]